MSANTQTKGDGGMKEFDQLPQSVRRALSEFPHNMDSGFALQMYKQGVSVKEILKMLEQERKQIGPVHPGAMK